MFIVKCPICDYTHKLKHQYELLGLHYCDMCEFDFQSNRCSDPDCRQMLAYTTNFCTICGMESHFYVNSYDIKPYFIDETDLSL